MEIKSKLKSKPFFSLNGLKLYMRRVYNSYEGMPILFTCVDSFTIPQEFLCLCSEIRGRNEFTITNLTQDTIDRMLRKDITIYEAFKLGGIHIIVTEDFKNRQTISFVDFNNIPVTRLPNKYTFLDFNEWDDKTRDKICIN